MALTHGARLPHRKVFGQRIKQGAFSGVRARASGCPEHRTREQPGDLNGDAALDSPNSEKIGRSVSSFGA